MEGAGDKGAIPELLRRHLYERGDFRDILGKPIPLNGKSAATKEGGIERYTLTAALRPGCRAVLVVLDADDEPSCSEGPALLVRAANEVKIPVVIALAERNYEDWIHSSLETLGLGDLQFVPGASGIAEIKRALYPKAYVKPTWQPRLTAKMDLELAASRSPSLGRLFERFDTLVSANL